MQSTLELTTKLPLAHYAPGDTVVREGDAAGGLEGSEKTRSDRRRGCAGVQPW
jgi:hypothetical protein